MAKMKFDAKEFMLNYGDRVGAGIAGFFALLFIIFAILGGGGGVSADQIKDGATQAASAITRSTVDPRDIRLEDEKTVYSLEQIDQLSRSLMTQISIDVLRLPYTFFEWETLRGNLKSNPIAFAPTEMTVASVIGGWRVYDTREVNQDRSVMVLQARGNAPAPKMGGGGNAFRPGQGVPGAGAPGGAAGMGGAAGLGGSGGGAAPPAPPPAGGRSGRGGNRQGDARGNRPAQPPPPTTGNPGGDESLYQPQWVNENQVKTSDILGVTLLPVRHALIYASYPHGRQVEELAKKLRIDKKENVENYYRGVDVQRRLVVPKNTLLPDGNYATEDMVWAADPKDRTKYAFRPLAEADKLAQESEDSLEAPGSRDVLAGWTNVNLRRVVSTMTAAYSVARSNNEGFHTESEPVVEQLVNYVGPRMALRLPKFARGDYPNLVEQLPQLKAAVQKIKDDANAKIPAPPKDPRLNRGGGDDPFGALSDEGKGNEQRNENNANRPSGSEGPNITGAIPDLVLVRFIDMDLAADSVGGATYEYRIRVVLNNPNFNKEREVAAPEFAKREMIPGPWSVARRVTFPEDNYVYADERVRARGVSEERDKAPVQLHKWLGEVDTLDRGEVPVGDWWVERLLVGRGEFIGKSPDLPGAAGEVNLIQWVSYAYDTVKGMIGADVQKKTRTTALMTRTLLVDFTGGNQQQFTGLNRSRRTEDVPTELLTVEPDGRLTAHYLGSDRNDEARTQRFSRWDEWVKKLPKPGAKEAPAPGR